MLCLGFKFVCVVDHVMSRDMLGGGVIWDSCCPYVTTQSINFDLFYMLMLCYVLGFEFVCVVDHVMSRDMLGGGGELGQLSFDYSAKCHVPKKEGAKMLRFQLSIMRLSLQLAFELRWEYYSFKST